MNLRILIRILLCAMLAVSVASCHSGRRTVRGSQAQQYHKQQTSPVYTPTEKPSGTAGQVIDEAYRWLGVPYLYGGNDRDGVDCSGLTCRVFVDGASIYLPRSSREQAEFARRIDRSKMRPGDLVFFVSQRGGDRINHVALYIGDNKVIHATTSRGVIISDLSERYWAEHFFCCGRVI